MLFIKKWQKLVINICCHRTMRSEASLAFSFFQLIKESEVWMLCAVQVLQVVYKLLWTAGGLHVWLFSFIFWKAVLDWQWAKVRHRLMKISWLKLTQRKPLHHSSWVLFFVLVAASCPKYIWSMQSLEHYFHSHLKQYNKSYLFILIEFKLYLKCI